MKKVGLLFFALYLGTSSGVTAQSRRPRTKVRTTHPMARAAEHHPDSRLMQAMLPATAKVMFIDSMVVGKTDFLSHLPLPPTSGRMTYLSAADTTGCYTNELADRTVFASTDSMSQRLYQRYLVGNQWDRAQPLAGIDASAYLWQNYPFLCADGVTLFFSAQGQESIGGQDIFMTSYDLDRSEWYKPQNYGLPFNSTANDYLLAIDDVDTLGWLVTDRHQPADSLCIYTFEPKATRVDFSADNLSPAQLRRYAEIHSIRDTWQWGDRKRALARLQAMKRHQATAQKVGSEAFVVRDGYAVYRAEDLKTTAGRHYFEQLTELQGMQAATLHELEQKRAQYAGTAPAGRQALTPEIQRLEREVLRQQADILMLRKAVRKAEIER